jgi:mRNA interferase RelE/StbE
VTPYRVEIERRAARQLNALGRVDQQRVRVAIALLAVDPRPPKCIPLSGKAGVFRVRVGDFRVVYRVWDDRLVVIVIRVGHRRAVYREL